MGPPTDVPAGESSGGYRPLAVAEEGGFTAAARHLHVVQSAVSGTLRGLERELSIRLFTGRRTGCPGLPGSRDGIMPATRPVGAT